MNNDVDMWYQISVSISRYLRGCVASNNNMHRIPVHSDLTASEKCQPQLNLSASPGFRKQGFAGTAALTTWTAKIPLSQPRASYRSSIGARAQHQIFLLVKSLWVKSQWISRGQTPPYAENIMAKLSDFARNGNCSATYYIDLSQLP